MRVFRYLIFLVFLALLGFLYYSQSTNFRLDKLLYYYPCETPIHYRIGIVDARFNLSSQNVQDISQNAALIWNRIYGKPLFVYDPNGDLTINLIFDARQQLTNEYNRLNVELKQKGNELKPQIEEYKKRVASFNERSKKFFEEIAYWNSQGGAPPNEFEKLVAEQKELQNEASQLNQISQSLNQTTDFFNKQVREFNRTVDTLNTTFKEKPEEGIYDSVTNSIEVYLNNNRKELIRTIAHEMGHARGLDHANNPISIMYSKTTDILKPSFEDVLMLKRVCEKQNKFILFWEVFSARLSNLRNKK